MTSDYSATEQRMLVLMALEDEGGTFSRDPGQVLYDLAFITGIGYKQMSRLLLMMEEEGLVRIERMNHNHPQRANKLIRISIRD